MRAFIQYVLVLLASWPGFVFAERVLIWNDTPLTVEIPVGEEVRVSFPTDVLLQIPASLTETLASLAPNQHIVYWRANAAFDAARVVAQSVDNRTVYLIDLVAREGVANQPLLIEDPDRIAESRLEHSSGSPGEHTSPELTDPPEIILTRFASQSLYAPSRLMPVNADITPLQDVRIATDFPLMRSQKSERYRFSIAGAWTAYGIYITALMVINDGHERIDINPGLIQGNFTHITAQHLFLGPAGSLEDRTTL